MTAAARVLICDDEPQIRRALAIVLSEAGFEVVPSSSAEEALDRAAVRPPQAAVIDLLLPGQDGVELCQRLRAWTNMPILLLSAIDEEREKVRALKSGADDYITKPFSSRELLARLEVALRRAAPDSGDSTVTVGELEVDLGVRTVRDHRGEIRPTPIEYELLRVLIRNRGRVMTHRSLLTEVWGPGYETDTPTLRFHIANLRKKIEAPGRSAPYIRTENGVGYRLMT